METTENDSKTPARGNRCKSSSGRVSPLSVENSVGISVEVARFNSAPRGWARGGELIVKLFFPDAIKVGRRVGWKDVLVTSFYRESRRQASV